MASFLRHRSPTSGSAAQAKSGTTPEPEPIEETYRLNLLSLPTEIHYAISKLLIYPDALSLKHTNAHFYSLVDTGVRLKVEWLMERRMLHLECPNDRRCDLGSDLRFCRGSVPLLMQRRREHMECESRPGLGCLVYGTSTCSHRSTAAQRVPRWLKAKLTVELWWVLLAFIPLMFCWMWMAELLR
ncbi:Fc.00g092710.m01.CDS01 [Cosmosporella sp. VM-42]